MPVVTISRTFGAGGAPVGQELARRLGAEFLDRAIVARAAERAGISEAEARGYDEQLPSVWQRVAQVLASSSSELAIPVLSTDPNVAGLGVDEQLSRLTRSVIEEAAAGGNVVIVGRGGAFVLRNHPDAFHVQLHASLEARVRNLSRRVEELPPDTRPDAASLRELCRQMDARRAEYIRRTFGVDWLSAEHFQLAIDTSSYTWTAIADLIEQAISHRGSPEDLARATPA